MSVEIDVAHREVMNLLKAVWEADPLSTDIPIFWKDVEGDTPDDGTSWIRATIVGGTAERVGIGQKARLYGSTGMLVIQIFTTTSSGLNFKDKLANILQKGFRGTTTSSGVRFETIKFNDRPDSGGWSQRNVTIDFTYETAS